MLGFLGPCVLLVGCSPYITTGGTFPVINFTDLHIYYDNFPGGTIHVEDKVPLFNLHKGRPVAAWGPG